MDALSLSSEWSGICRRMVMHSTAMAAKCGDPFNTLITRGVQELLRLSPPTDDRSLQARRDQSYWLNSKIRNIAHADAMSRRHPRAAAEIARIAAGYCDRDKHDGRPDSESSAFNSAIRNICASDDAKQ